MTKVGSRCPAVCFGGMGHDHAPSSEAPSAAIEPMYGDDDPVEPTPAHAPLGGGGRTSAGLLVLKTHCEYSAAGARQGHGARRVRGSRARQGGKAPSSVAAPESSAAAAASRAPLDLVTVLDVSGSMAGEKLELVKRAMGFLIDNLGSDDRLSVVAFSTDARRIIRLTRMSDDGKAAAKRGVESLAASGCTNIRGGLDVTAMVLDGRRHKNAVASVILLSDGQDNQSMHHEYLPTSWVPKHSPAFSKGGYDVLVPPSFQRTAGGDHRCVTVHTFGFGIDHDAAAMHYISEVTGSTFSFIENHAVIQDAFARCIGGLLSVAVQKARISLECGASTPACASWRSSPAATRAASVGAAAPSRWTSASSTRTRRGASCSSWPCQEPIPWTSWPRACSKSGAPTSTRRRGSRWTWPARTLGLI